VPSAGNLIATPELAIIVNPKTPLDSSPAMVQAVTDSTVATNGIANISKWEEGVAGADRLFNEEEAYGQLFKRRVSLAGG